MPVSHLFAMFEQMCAQIHDVLLSPTHSCHEVLMLQVASMIQSPLNVMKVCFSMTEGRRVTLQSTGTQHLHLSSYPYPHSASSFQSSQHEAVVKAVK